MSLTCYEHGRTVAKAVAGARAAEAQRAVADVHPRARIPLAANAARMVTATTLKQGGQISERWFI